MLVGAIVVIDVRLIAGGQTWADVDYHTAVAPPRLAAADAIRAGALPAWWDAPGLGAPLAAAPAHAAMYPPTWLATSPRGLDLAMLVHLAWAALGIAVWARRRGSEQAAVVVALLAATSGVLASAAVRGALPALAHLPWVALAALAVRAAEAPRARLRAAAGLAGALGLIALTGVFAILVDAIALAAVLAAQRRRATWFALVGALAGGLAIGAAQWVPALLASAPGALRGGEVHGLPLARLLELIVPGSFGAADPGRAIAALAGSAPWAPSVFVGAPLLALAAVRTPGPRLAAALAGGVVLVLVVGRGGWPAVLGAPELHLGALAILLAVHAAPGVDALLAAERRALLALAAGVACATAALIALAALRSREPAATAAVDRALLDGGLGVACAVGALLLAWRGRALPVVLALLVVPSVGASRSTAPLVDRAGVSEPAAWPLAAIDHPPPHGGPRRLFRPAFMGAGVQTAGEAVATFAGTSGWRWGVAAARDPADPLSEATWRAAAADGGALLDRYGISLAILPSSMIMPRRLTSLGVRDDWALIDLPVAPVAAVLRGAAWARAPEDALALLFAHHAAAPRGTVVLAGAGPSIADRGPPLPCTVERWDPGAIDLACTSDAPGYAVVSSTPAPGWRVEVDGAARPWLTADVLRRAVEVAPGRHRVAWRYAAPGLVAGAALSLIAAVAAAAIALAARRRRERGADV